MRWFPYFLLVYATYFWGATFIFVKATVALIPVNYFLFLRFSIASLVGFPVVAYRGKLRSKKLWKTGTVLGTLLFASFYFQTIGLQLTTPSRAAFVTGLNVVFIPIITTLNGTRRITKREAFGVILSLVGTFLLTITFGEYLSVNQGDLIILLTALSIAFHIIRADKITSEEVLEVLWVQFLVMGVWAFVILQGSPKPAVVWYHSQLIVFTLVLTVGFATVFAFGAQFYAQNSGIRPTHIGIIFSMEPVFALLIDLLVGQIPSPQAITGMGLILMAIVTIVTQTEGAADLLDTQDKVGL